MLRAYVDDSHTSESGFVLAGYIAPAEAWAAFSGEWQAILDMNPPLKRFKMSEANYWSEQQWNERLPLDRALAAQNAILYGAART